MKKEPKELLKEYVRTEKEAESIKLEAALVLSATKISNPYG